MKPTRKGVKVNTLVSLNLMYTQSVRRDHVINRTEVVPSWVVGYGDCSDCGCRLCDTKVLALDVEDAETPVSICLDCAAHQLLI